MAGYNVNIPVDLGDGRAFSVNFSGRSPRWTDLRPEFIRGNDVEVPAHVFHHTRAVRDEPTYVWHERQLHEVTETRAIRPGCIFLAAESPHKDEYAPETGSPLSPLRRRETRDRIFMNLPRLIESAEAQLNVRLNGVDVALGNPIQYQTSLQSLLKEPNTGLRAGIRNAVWHNLFRNQRFKDDFERRLRACQPVLLIMATTAGVRADLREFTRHLRLRSVEVRQHPCVWSGITSLALCP